MSEIASQLVVGYHGCDRSVGEKVLSGAEHLLPSKNKYDWLGAGIYFWERDQVRALEYAEQVSTLKAGPRISDPFVIGAVIELGYCIDFLQRDNIGLIERAYARLKEAFEKDNKPLPRNKRVAGHPDFLLRNLDCAVIEALHTYLARNGQPPCDTVRAAFWEGEELYPNAGFRRQNHIQICVRNPNCIKGYFRPLKKVEAHSLPGAF